MSDDAACLTQYAQARNETAFAAFVRRNLRLVYSAAHRQCGGDPHAAEEITQTVFIAASRHAARLARHPVIAAWLFQTTRHVAIDAIRARRRREAREQEAAAMSELTVPPESRPEWAEVSAELDGLVAALSGEDREALILRFFGEKTFPEIAAQLQVGESAARMRVERALEKLRGGLARRGIVSTGAALGAILAQNAAIAAPPGLAASTVLAALSAPAVTGLPLLLSTLKLVATMKLTTLATVLAVAGLATAFCEFRSAQTATAALAEARAQTATARQEAAQAIQAAQTHEAAVRAKAATAASAPTAAAHPASPFAAMLNLLSNPAMQRQTSITAKIRLDSQYAPLFRSLNLPPAQLDQFKNLLVEKQMVGFDSMAAAHDQGMDFSSDPRGFFQAVAAAEKTVDTQIVSVLGDDGYTQFQQYQKTIPARNTSTLVSQALSYTDTPLTPTQSEALIQALAQGGTPPLPPENPFAVLNSDLGVIAVNEQGRAQIQGILSPAQLEILKDKISQQNDLLQTRSKMGR